ncbi:MAG TPA: hypothetical protein VM577_14565 [Anaerovoracaceae bacterium]|nr:hypothetical protein [Anaerovoracaceae bacterium]
MTKKTDLIKNPARQLNQMAKRERYVPNYVKMGLETPQPAKVPNSDFEYAFNKRKPFVTSSGGKKENETPKLPNVAVVSASSNRRSVPKQVMVSSGFSHEHTWHPVAKFYDEETIPEGQVDMDEFPWQEEEETDENVGAERISYDEVEVEQRQPMKSGSEAPKSAKYHQLSALEEGEYCIAVDGNIVHISSSLVEIEDMVEYILFDQNSPLGDISVESVSVFKRMSVKAGILVKD